jgi:hypothetical protein
MESTAVVLVSGREFVFQLEFVEQAPFMTPQIILVLWTHEYGIVFRLFEWQSGAHFGVRIDRRFHFRRYCLLCRRLYRLGK